MPLKTFAPNRPECYCMPWNSVFDTPQQESFVFTNIQQIFKWLLSSKCSKIHHTALWVTVLAIFYLATTSVDHTIQSTFSDKFNHLIAFIVLSLLAHIAYPVTQKIKWAVALFGYGLLIEVVQYFLPHREFSLLDLVTDLSGIICYLVVFYSFVARFLNPLIGNYSNT